MKRIVSSVCVVFTITFSACGSDTEPVTSTSQTLDDQDSENQTSEQAAFPAVVGTPATGYLALVDLAVRTLPDGSRRTFVAEQFGTIRLVEPDGTPGQPVADFSTMTTERGEQGLLGLAFSPDGTTAYVNYTDLDGDTTVDTVAVNEDGTFDMASRRSLYTLDQPYRNHNGGDLMVSPDGRYLYIFNGDGGSGGDPDRHALDAATQLGKIVQVDLQSTGADSVSIWASGLRNPWRAYRDPVTDDLWIADVGQNLWEEINVVPFSESQGVSFGWSAFEGTEVFNADQMAVHAQYEEVTPIHTYPHENDDCSISGGAVYRGTSIPVVGTWYVFSDFCSGNVRALCVTESRTACGVVDLGTVANSVAVLPDGDGELWVLSASGELVPIISQS